MMRTTALLILVSVVAPRAQAGFFLRHWIPEDMSCAADDTVHEEAVAADDAECSADAAVIDSYGQLRTHWPLHRQCMEDRGWTDVTHGQEVAWRTDCAAEEEERAAPVVAELALGGR